MRKTNEPVGYQCRIRPEWRDKWSEWEHCSKAAYEDYLKTPLLHDWHYQVRALYDHAPAHEQAKAALPQPVAAEGVAGWQPIETAPKDGTLLVLGAKNGIWLGKYLPVYQSGFRPENPWSSMMLNHDHMAERYTRPTHWMPLPAAPTQESGK